MQRSAVRIYRDHREPALYRATSSGVEHEIPDYIFRDAHEEQDLSPLEDAVSSRAPEIDFRLADLPVAPVQGAYVYVPRKAQWYTVADVQPDGEGMVKLPLVRSAHPANQIA